MVKHGKRFRRLVLANPAVLSGTQCENLERPEPARGHAAMRRSIATTVTGSRWHYTRSVARRSFSRGRLVRGRFAANSIRVTVVPGLNGYAQAQWKKDVICLE